MISSEKTIKLSKTIIATTITTTLLLAGGAALADSLSCASQENDWVSVLIEENPPTLDDPQTWVNKVKLFAPNLKQILLRVKPVDASEDNTSLVNGYTNLIKDLRSAYPNIEIGFHPDNDKHDFAYWKDKSGTPCTADWKCVVNQSLNIMNQIDNQLKTQSIKGFDIYSVEQSYIETTDPSMPAEVKKYLTQQVPGIKYAYVSPGYSPELISKSQYDYEYPQYYNLWTDKKSGEVPNLPEISTAPTATNFEVMDARPPQDPVNVTVLPNYSKSFLANGTSVYQNGDPQLAATYLSYILHERQASYPMTSNNGTIFITLSGESEFLGGDKWTLQNVCKFHQDLINDLQSQGIDVSNVQFAIWNVSNLIDKVKQQK